MSVYHHAIVDHQEIIQRSNHHKQGTYHYADWETFYDSLDSVEQYQHPVNSDTSTSTLTADTQPLLNMSPAVSDTYLPNGAEREHSDLWENISLNQDSFPVHSLTLFSTHDSTYQNTDNTESTVYDNYLPEEPDVPLSGVISETFQVLGLNIRSDFNLTDQMQTDFKIRNFCVSLVDTIFKKADDYNVYSRIYKDTESSTCDTLGTDSTPCKNEQDHKDVLVKDVRPKSDAKHKKVQAKTKDFQCLLCTYKTRHKSKLIRHMRVHTNEKPFVCEVCGQAFTQQNILTTHMRRHTGEKPFVCEVCGHAFTQHSNLTAHMRRHTGEKPFQCDQCDYKSVVQCNLTVHMRRHTGEKPFQCDQCDYKSVLQGNLTRHMRIHSGEKPFQCDQCDYKSTHGSNLRKHMRKHTGEKRFPCTLCDYKSVQQSDLTKHMRKHSGEKPFHCKLCDYKAARKGTLVHHVKKHNKET